jgi:ABC-type phosphate transport system substrate-binding protein
MEKRMKRIILGLAIGIALSTAVALIAMCNGEEFRTTVLKYGVEDGTGIIATEHFVVLFHGVHGDDAGSGSITYAGRHGTLPALWSGYSTGWRAGDKGITSYHTYDPHQGRALLFHFGKLVLIEESGRFLRVQNQRFRLGKGSVVVSVNADGSCKPLTDKEAREIYEALAPWYKDGLVSARPLELQANQLVERDARNSRPSS